MIDIKDIWKATDGGRTIIEELYPQSKGSFTKRKNFKIREDDKSPSCSVFKDKSKEFWFFQDKGGNDNKAKNAIMLIQEKMSLSYYDSLKYIAEKYCNGLNPGYIEPVYPEPVIEKTAYKDDKVIVKEKTTFEIFELQTLGKNISDEICQEFSLSSVGYYITKEGYKVNSTNKYPIYYYNYGDWGKIYQPLGKKEFRFFYVGNKPDDVILFNNKAHKLWHKVNNSHSLEEEEKLKDLIICSGPSDAINIFANSKYDVAWMNSETAILTDYQYNKLTWMADNIYLLMDIDQTGIRIALKLGMRFLNLKIIWLPNNLKTFRDHRGKSCKDAKDFFNYYHDPKWPNLSYYFNKLVESSFSLCFWDRELTKTSIKYDINNEQLYAFLSANGFYQMSSKANKKESVFIRIIDNVVQTISENEIVKVINNFLINFLRENLDYYDLKLVNMVHRSSQIKLESLSKLKEIELNFKCYGPGFDHLFFKNIALKITNKGIEQYKNIDTGVYILKEKIIDFDFDFQDKPFNIEYSKEYLKARKENATEDFDELEKFNLEIYDKDFSIIRYLYNTGRVHWKKESLGGQLTRLEKKEQDLHFISKICALGFSLYRYKERGRPYFLYAMETEQGALGSSRGGTGKSFFFSMIEEVRNVVNINGRRRDLMDDKHVFSQVVKDVTDFVYYDDIGEFVDLHIFLSAISGKMEIRPLFIDTYMLDFEESPKLGGSSNHPVRNIDPSIRRRLWFMGFSDYYHHEDSTNAISERSLLSEFGKNLITDFTYEEMNRFYNVMAWSMHFYLKFSEKINPPIADINTRNIQGLLGDDFIDWADNYFTEDKLNENIEKTEAFNDYLSTLSERSQKYFKKSKFKIKLQNYAEYKGYIFNPSDLFTTETEIVRNDIRVNRNGKDMYCFHYRTRDFKKKR